MPDKENWWPEIGSRVLIIAKDHPWHGRTGILSSVDIITSGGTELGRVKLDSPQGHKAGIFDPRDLRVLLTGERDMRTGT